MTTTVTRIEGERLIVPRRASALVPIEAAALKRRSRVLFLV